MSQGDGKDLYLKAICTIFQPFLKFIVTQYEDDNSNVKSTCSALHKKFLILMYWNVKTILFVQVPFIVKGFDPLYFRALSG